MNTHAPTPRTTALVASLLIAPLTHAQPAIIMPASEPAPVKPTEAHEHPPTIAEMLESPELAYLADAFRDTGLDENDNLSNDRMTVTLIAPSKAYWNTPEVAQLREPGNEAALRDLLSKHLVYGDLTANFFGKDKTYLTQRKKPDAPDTSFDAISATVDENGELRLDGVRIVDTMPASNGRIYMIDGVLPLKETPTGTDTPCH